MDSFRFQSTLLLSVLAFSPFAYASMGQLDGSRTQAQSLNFNVDQLQLSSFYRNTGQDHTQGRTADRAWGFQMASALPINGVNGVRARLDYSMAAVPTHSGLAEASLDTTSFTAGDNHLLQLHLDSQWQAVRYGMRYFSAGADIGNVGVGRDLLNQAGAAAAADGAEVWAQWRVAEIEVQPSAARLVRQQPGTRIIEDRAGLHISHPHWRLDWRNQTHTHLQDDQSRFDESQQLSATLKVLDAITLAPSVSRQRAGAGAVELQTSSAAALNVGYQPDQTHRPQLNLTLRFNQRAGVLENAQDVSADLGVRKTIQLPGAQSTHTSVSASLSYRRSENTLTGIRDNRMGVMFTLEHHVGG